MKSMCYCNYKLHIVIYTCFKNLQKCNLLLKMFGQNILGFGYPKKCSYIFKSIFMSFLTKQAQYQFNIMLTFNFNLKTYETKAPSLPRPVLSGLVWHQTSGLFSRWREVFVILTRDCIRCHKISGSSKNAQFGGLLFSVDLVLVTDVR